MNHDMLALARDLLTAIGPEDSPPRLTPIQGGRSGALTYRVDVGSRSYALRVQPEQRFTAHFSQLAELQNLAGQAGLAPAVFAVDAERRAMLSEFISAEPLIAALRGPTSQAVLNHIGSQLGILHQLEPPPSLADRCPTARTTQLLEALRVEGPRFLKLAAERAGDIPPSASRSLCHLDLNPTNILFDGQRVRFVDWETAGLSDPAFDVATLVNLLLLDLPSQEALLRGYASVTEPPSAQHIERARRHVYLGYGAEFLRLATAPAPDWEPDELPRVAEAYADLAAGRLDLASTEGQWRLGAAYIGELLRMPPL